ncbi:MAG: LysM domain-containing protein [Phycisphaerales bacterium]
MKTKVIFAVLAVVLVGIGGAGGFFAANTKSKAVIGDMQAKMQKEQSDSQERIRGYDMMVSTISAELQKTQVELEKYKASAPQLTDAASEFQTTSNDIQSQPTASVTTRRPAARETIEYERPDGPTGNELNTRIYTIQSGDSLWTIAQKQLGNGSRFNEILKLNPKLTAKSNLVVGSRLKLPLK